MLKSQRKQDCNFNMFLRILNIRWGLKSKCDAAHDGNGVEAIKLYKGNDPQMGSLAKISASPMARYEAGGYEKGGAFVRTALAFYRL